MEYDKHLAILSCINISIWTTNFGVGDVNLVRQSNNASSVLSTKKSSLQMLKYSHWPKREFCRPQWDEFNFLEVRTNWLNPTAWGNALI